MVDILPMFLIIFEPYRRVYEEGLVVTRDGSHKVKDFIRDTSKNFAIVYVVIALIFVLWIITRAVLGSNVFLGSANIINILRQVSVVGIVAAGQFFAIVTGLIDLSVGSTVALAGITYAAVFKVGGTEFMAVAILGALLVGLVVGLVNGSLIAYFRLTPFIATLGMMLIVRGAIYVATGAQPIFGFEKWYNYPGRGWIIGIPVPVIIMFVLYIVLVTFAERKKAGRYLYAIGGNADAAYLSGINVRKYKLLALVICGVLCSIAGIILAGRLDSGQPNAGEGDLLFDSIIAVVIGGVSFSGGKGRLLGVLFGALFMTILSNGMTLLGIDSYVQSVAKGIIFIFAIALDVFRNRETV
jgi:ribose/xylose/arabinose/galactoside ABC-type transport system permease subunit